MKNPVSTLIFGLLFLFHTAVGQNPIIQTSYTADPAPLVYGQRVYLYTGQDEDNSTWFTMNKWRLYSTADMVNWTDHGAVLDYKMFGWAKGDAWAAQCIERNGKFYFYVTLTSRFNNRPAIGVAVATSPFGPFYDPLGKPLVQTERGDIDPTAFVDANGAAYLYWGNPDCKFVKLNEDMISYSGEVVRLPMQATAFGSRAGNINERPTLYEEGPWLYKRKDLYYLLWAGGPIPEHLGYSTSSSPAGPWKYGGMIMPPEGRSFTNHPGLIDFNGKSYLFYHNGALPGGSGFTRSICVQEMKFNKDGAIIPMKMKPGIAAALVPLNPYQKTEAETISFSEHVITAFSQEAGVFITAVGDGAYTKVRSVDFGKTGASVIKLRAATSHNSHVEIEMRLNSVDGPLIGTVSVPNTGGSDHWAICSMPVRALTGIRDICFVFRGKAAADILHFDYWMAAYEQFS
ncbi:glycoside hydrolase family 43 protein [Niabella terrae]